VGLFAGKNNDAGIDQIVSIEEKYLSKKIIFMLLTLLALLV